MRGRDKSWLGRSFRLNATKYTNLPLSVGVDGSLGAAVEDVGGADVAAALVVILGVRVAAENKNKYNKTYLIVIHV
jgi:hypothetical protein